MGWRVLGKTRGAFIGGGALIKEFTLRIEDTFGEKMSENETYV